MSTTSTLTATIARQGPRQPASAVRGDPRHAARPRVVALHRPRWARIAHALATSWARWRAATQRRRDERLVAALPRHVLCDVGLGHLVHDLPRVPWPDIERARW